MELKLSTEKRTEYTDRIKDVIKDPSYSIFVILGFPFILALIGGLFDPFSMFVILVGPIITLACYAYYTGNKLSSAMLGLVVIPLMFFYAGPIGAIVDFQLSRLDRYFEWTYIFDIIDDFWKYSLAHSLIGFLIAFRKIPYLLLALLIFVLQLMELLSHVD
ncbi:hypothetical protein LI82_06975 [Methanococcoides methylutens]|uniref:Uncharacterized protein n=1 Tax=Methanococcoides methylutens TaxID=2226 RepID=A0A099T0C1_METMT|nr:hypothetical protein [Methanococcoides methylutens]KGK98605.1 hypothetical protein LI82_06975 [Methanococcoides methylutens]